jgi:hypothetical protein
MSIRQGHVRRRAAGALLCAVVVLAGSPVASAGKSAQVAWVRQFGSPAMDEATGVAVASSGIYVVGATNGSLPGQVSQGNTDAFVRKYGTSGKVLWTRQFGSPGTDDASGVAVASSGIYVVGTTGGTLPGQTSSGGQDAFVRKYDVAGNVIWTRQFGTSTLDRTYAVASTGAGVYVAGVTWGLFPANWPSGNTDGFVRKYTHAGNAAWTTQFGTSDDETVASVAATSSRIHAVGFTRGTFAGQSSSGGFDGFVVTLGASGGLIEWTRQFGTPGDDTVRAVDVTPAKIVLGGATQGAFPGGSSSGGFDGFVRTFEPDGANGWTRQFGTPAYDSVRAVAATGRGFYAAGITDGTLPGQSSAGDRDTFVRRFRPGGGVAWTRQVGTTGIDESTGVAVSGSGAYVAGRATAAFPGQSNAGLHDAFLAKLVSRRPDGRIRRAGETSFVGNDVYNTNGVGQTRVAQAPPGTSRTFQIRAQNDGDGVDRITVDGCGSSRGFRVRYLRGASGTTNITSAVVAGTFTFPEVTTGESKALRLEVTVTTKSTPGATKSCKVLLSSAHRPTAADAVRAKVSALG